MYSVMPRRMEDPSVLRNRFRGKAACRRGDRGLAYVWPPIMSAPTGRDVAERRKSSAAHVRAILDNTLDAVMAMDAEGVIRFWNPRAERTFGWAREEAIGTSLLSLIVDAADRERLRLDLARANAAGDGVPQRTEVTG